MLSVVSITSTKNITELCVDYRQEHDNLRMQGRRQARQSWGKATISIGSIKVPLVLPYLLSDMFTEELLLSAKDPGRMPFKRTHRKMVLK